MLNCSIALQILPLHTEDGLATIEEVIAYLDGTGKHLVVSPFESVIEGEYEELMEILKQAILLAGKRNKNIFANVKIHYGDIMTTDEKISKYNH